MRLPGILFLSMLFHLTGSQPVTDLFENEEVIHEDTLIDADNGTPLPDVYKERSKKLLTPMTDMPVQTTKRPRAPTTDKLVKTTKRPRAPTTDKLVKTTKRPRAPTTDKSVKTTNRPRAPTTDKLIKTTKRPRTQTTDMSVQTTKRPRAPTTDMSVKNKKGPRLWPQEILFYNTISSNDFTPAEIATIEEAMEVWSKYSCVMFTTIHSSNFITFQKGSSCQSEVGMKGGEQIVQISDDCNTESAIVEMLGHAIGLEKKPRQSNNSLNLNTSGKKTLVTFDEISDVNLKYGCQFDKDLGTKCWLTNDSCPDDGFIGTDCACWCRGDTGYIYQYCQPISEDL